MRVFPTALQQQHGCAATKAPITCLWWRPLPLGSMSRLRRTTASCRQMQSRRRAATSHAGYVMVVCRAYALGERQWVGPGCLASTDNPKHQGFVRFAKLHLQSPNMCGFCVMLQSFCALIILASVRSVCITPPPPRPFSTQVCAEFAKLHWQLPVRFVCHPPPYPCVVLLCVPHRHPVSTGVC